MSTVDIVVPVYKVEKYLSRCLNSILNQTLDDYRLIVVDDGSPDMCPSICDEYEKNDPRIHVIHQSNGGLSAARNSGIEWALMNSNSKWITFIDSDDWVHPKYLELLLNAVEQTKCDVSVCGIYTSFGDSPNIPNQSINIKIWNTEDFFIKKSVDATVAWGKIYEKSCFKKLRYPVGRLHEDEYTTFKILFKYSTVAVVDVPLYFYFQNTNSIMHKKSRKMNLDAYPALEEQIEYFSEHGFNSAKRSVIRRYLVNVNQKCNDKGLNAETRSYFRKLKKKNFCKYSKQLLINDQYDAWVLTKIYPRQMKLYWYYCALKNRIKKFEISRR